MVERLNVQVELDAGDGVEQILPLRSGCFETRQRAPLRSVHRRMNGIPAPLDEKRQQAAVIVLEPEGPPPEEFAIRALARAGLRTFKLDSLLAKLLGEFVEIVAVRGPANKPGFGQLGNNRVLLHAGLLGIGRDDFEVATLDE